MMSYTEAIDFLFVRTTGQFKFGLERTTEVLDAMGNPHRRVPCFHVAGTNGKGSTVAMIATLVRARGFRVATYTSPHLVDFRERIEIDGARIEGHEVVEFVERWTPAIERIGASFFEATTAMAFHHFARHGAQVAVIETGLGGRLDSTNVVDPLVATVTSIGRDHTEYLGETLEAIASEKAGIFKPGRPAVIGEPDPALRDHLVQKAGDAGAEGIHVVDEQLPVSSVRVSLAGTSFTAKSEDGATEVHTPLVGAHQARNAAIALATVKAAGKEYEVPLRTATKVLSAVRLRGRFDRRGPYIFDVAHNVDGMRTLAATLAAVNPPRPIVAVLNVLRDKEWAAMLLALAPAVDHIVLTVAPTSPESRRWSPKDASELAMANGIQAKVVESFTEALEEGRRLGATVVVTGSFHTVGDAMASLGMEP